MTIFFLYAMWVLVCSHPIINQWGEIKYSIRNDESKFKIHSAKNQCALLNDSQEMEPLEDTVHWEIIAFREHVTCVAIRQLSILELGSVGCIWIISNKLGLHVCFHYSKLNLLKWRPYFVLYAYIIGPRLDLLIEAVLVLIPEGRVANQQDV